MLFFQGKKMVTINNTQDQVGEGHFGRVYTFEGDTSKVIKVFKTFTGEAVEKEFKAQHAAWQLGLAPEPLEFGWTDDYKFELIVMRRVTPVAVEGFSQRELAKAFNEFARKLKAYHDAGWAHGDIKRPDHVCGGAWDNVWLTAEGVVLLDYGTAIHKDDFPDFPEECAEQAEADLEDLEEYRNVLKRSF